MIVSYPKGSGCNVPFKIRYQTALQMTKEEVASFPAQTMKRELLERVFSRCAIIKDSQASKQNFATYCPESEGGKAEFTLWHDMPIASLTLHPASKVGDLTKEYRQLRAEHWKGKPPEATGEVDSAFMYKVDLEQAEKILDGNDSRSKADILEKLRSNLWTATPVTLAARIRRIDKALDDQDPKVQVAALKMFDYDARVVSGMPLLKKMVDRLESLAPEVRAATAKAMIYLLSTADKGVSQVASLARRYGTVKPQEILAKSGGIIESEDQEAFHQACHNSSTKTDTVWQPEHVTSLRQDLMRVQARADIAPALKTELADAIRKYGWHGLATGSQAPAGGATGESPVSR